MRKRERGMTKINEASLRLLVILKNDTRRLFERIKYREREYLTILSLKRTREHFKDVFKSLYETITIDQLSLLSEEVIVALDEFYAPVEKLRWYLNHSEDMPATMKDNVRKQVNEIESKYELLKLYINAEIGIEEDNSAGESLQDQENYVIPLAENVFDEEFPEEKND